MRIMLRSSDYRVRLQAAIWCLRETRDHETVLEDALSVGGPPEELRSLQTRLLATARTVESWEDYINGGCVLEPRAQITPTIYKRLLKV